MLTQTLGEFRIDRVVESEGPFAPVASLLPGFDRSALTAAGADLWLRPDFLSAEDVVVMSFHSFIIRTRGLTVLVDACVGNDKDRPHRPAWHQRRSSAFLDQMRACGLSPDDIDIVMCTHLHADHVGWNTVLRDGRWVPTFPRARYLFSKEELTFWEKQHREALASGAPVPNHGSYADSVLPVVEAGCADLIGPNHDLAPGLRIEALPGHTPGNSVLTLRSAGKQAVFTGDVLHTPVQVAFPHWSSRFCEDPELSARSRARLLDEVCDSGTMVMAAHFPSPTAGVVEAEGGGRMRWCCTNCR